ncbi:MAG: lactate utilization protein [Fusicatenibacter sp.]|nr:lactate utilization protein [Lachnospiraceae bacterium]MDY2937724.1 lactate utilization protein [Fusicatenibacter sp.]
MKNAINCLAEKLIGKGYHVQIFNDKESAADYINREIDGKIVGFGGSVTIHQMELFSKLSAHNDVCWHEERQDNMSIMEARKKASASEIYISSVNAVSEKGEIVNIDNTGNRVAAISFGPSEVYLVIGRNKICVDLSAALERARNVAAPLNAKRLNRKTPCAVKSDKCYDCKSPERICRNLSVLYEKPTGAVYHVILINEDLGY